MVSVGVSLTRPPDLPSIDEHLHSLHRCRGSGNIAHARRVLLSLSEYGLELHPAVRDYVVPMLVECGAASEAHQVFRRLPYGNEHSWTFLILGYIQCGLFHQALCLFPKMQEAGIQPSSYTLVALLKACSRLGDVESGRDIHQYLIQRGFLRNPYVGSTLIDMYSKCGSLLQAREVFDQLAAKELVAWNALIAGYTENGYGQEALDCLEEMKHEGIVQDTVTFVCSLKACGIVGAIEKGRSLEADIFKRGFEKDLLVGNSLIAMHAKSGSIDEAWAVFNHLPARNVVSWNTLIAEYAEVGPWIEAMNCFEAMQREGIPPDSITFTCIIKVCTILGNIENGQTLHMAVIAKGFERNLAVGNSLVNMYANCRCFAETWHVLYGLQDREVVTWNTVIASFAECGLGHEALRCFKLMQTESISPNVLTLVSVFKVCGTIKAIEKGYELQSEMVQKGCLMDVSIRNALITMYADCGLVLRSEEVFNMMPYRNIASWTTLLAGYTQNGMYQSTMEFFNSMNLHGISPTTASFACILKACGKNGATLKGNQIHKLIVEKGLENDTLVGNSLIDMYVNVSSFQEAQSVFDRMPVKDVATWTSMIRGCGMSHQADLAICLFEAMQAEGVRPNAITFTCLLTAFCHANLVSKGQEYFNMMREEYQILPTIEHFTCMIDLLAKAGRFHEAERFIEMLCLSSQSIWSALLNGCRTYVETELGLRCFHELVSMNPEDATWYVLMTDIHLSDGRYEDAATIEELRKHAGLRKKTARASIEVSGQIHTFTVGEEQSEEVLRMLELLNVRMKEARYFPNLESVPKAITDEGKELELCDHAEKLAIAFGLLNTPQGQTLRVSKNLRTCADCHAASKIISYIEKRDIVLRDESCVHHFKNGFCSCSDMF